MQVGIGADKSAPVYLTYAGPYSTLGVVLMKYLIPMVFCP